MISTSINPCPPKDLVLEKYDNWVFVLLLQIHLFKMKMNNKVNILLFPDAFQDEHLNHA